MLAALALVILPTQLTGCGACPDPVVVVRPTLPPGKPADPSAWIQGLQERLKFSAGWVQVRGADWNELLERYRDEHEWALALEAGANWKTETE